MSSSIDFAYSRTCTRLVWGGNPGNSIPRSIAFGYHFQQAPGVVFPSSSASSSEPGSKTCAATDTVIGRCRQTPSSRAVSIHTNVRDHCVDLHAGGPVRAKGSLFLCGRNAEEFTVQVLSVASCCPMGHRSGLYQHWAAATTVPICSSRIRSSSDVHVVSPMSVKNANG